MMRKIVGFSVKMLLLAVLLSACSGQKSPFSSQSSPLHFNKLKTIETLLETNPAEAMDSVDALKSKIGNVMVTPLDYNELLLREVQAQYKNRRLTETSPDLAPVVRFYDSVLAVYPENTELQYILANTYYYKGVESAFVNDDVDAFSCYLQALGTMETRSDWSDLSYADRFIGLTYTRLSEILYRYGLNDAALATCRKAFSHYAAEADRAAMLRYEAAIYQSERNYDKALAVFDEAEALASVGDNFIQAAIGGRYYELQQYDSAVPHLQRAFATGDRYARVDAAMKLAEISRDRGLTDDELRYTRFYVENSMMESRMASRKMEIGYLYDESNRPKAEATPTDAGFSRTAVVMLALLMAVIALMTFIIIRNRRRITHIESKITSIEQKHEQENADKDLEIEQISQQLNETRERLETKVETVFDDAWKAFSTSAIAMKINGMVEDKDIMIKNVGVFPKLKLKEMDYIELVREANRCFPDFSMRLLKAYPELNVTDFRHGCLALLGMNDAQLAVLEGISYSGSNRRTNKFLGVLGLGDNLEQALLTYLRENY